MPPPPSCFAGVGHELESQCLPTSLDPFMLCTTSATARSDTSTTTLTYFMQKLNKQNVMRTHSPGMKLLRESKASSFVPCTCNCCDSSSCPQRMLTS